MAAMPEEIDALKPFIRSARLLRRAGREYFHGELFGQETVTVFSRWGKVASASTATELINSFSVSSIMLIGIAGSVSHLNIGDIVVATDCVQHDLDPRPFFPVTQVPMLGICALPTDDAMRHSLAAVCESAARESNQWLDETLRHTTGITRPSVWQGRMATGDQVVSSEGQRLRVVENAPGSLCVDMESAAVAQVAFEHAIPFGCVRVISDGADERIAHTVAPFLGGLASAYTVAIVRRWLTSNR